MKKELVIKIDSRSFFMQKILSNPLVVVFCSTLEGLG